MTISVTATNLTQGPGVLYWGAFGASEPALTDVGTTPDSGVWTDVGATQDGVTLKISQEFSEMECDQLVDRVGSRLTKREMAVTTNMAEPTLENLALAANGAGTIASGSGYKSYAPGNDNSVTQPNYKGFMFDGWAPGDAKNRRVIVRKALSTEGLEFAYKKDSMTIFSATFTAHYVSPSVTPYVVVDEV